MRIYFFTAPFLYGSSAADKRVGPLSVEASVWVKEEIPCSFLASVIHDSFWMQRTRAIQETAEASVGGLIEEAIRKIKNRAPEGQRGFSNTDYSL